MLLEDADTYTWHFKRPSNKKTLEALKLSLGEGANFPANYTKRVKIQKEMLFAGTNAPRKGYLFLDDAKWEIMCKRFTDLIKNVLKAHGVKNIKNGRSNEAPNDADVYANLRRKIRHGQRVFRRNLLDQYDCKCAISGYSPIDVLEAAHITSHSESGINSVNNGLLLRADIHSLFDSGMLKINPKSFKVSLSRELKKSKYKEFHGTKITCRKDGGYPDKDFLTNKWNGA